MSITAADRIPELHKIIEIMDRELAKRRTTYPKIVARKQKQWHNQDLDYVALTIELTNQQRIQYELLEDAIKVLKGDKTVTHYNSICLELYREYQMRKKYYPRFVYFKRMTAETAENELLNWEMVLTLFKNEYCPDFPTNHC